MQAIRKTKTAQKTICSFAERMLLFVFCGSLFLGGFLLFSVQNAQAATSLPQIHILSVSSGMDAIVLENNGHFGIIDSGETNIHPDGSDPRYPVRDGLSYNQGIDDRIIAYLDTLGVNSSNLDFYLGTHPHSDHIGTAKAVIERYKPQRVYAQYYDDSVIKDEDKLWDNQFFYDRLRYAACEPSVGATFIQYFSTAAPVDPARDPDVPAQPTSSVLLDGITINSYTGAPSFYLGGTLLVEIENIKDVAKIAQTQGPFHDANDFSLGVKLTAFVDGEEKGTAFLSGDINNFDYSSAPYTNHDEDKLAPIIGKVDFLKMGHHGYDGSNSDSYLRTLDPSVALYTNESLAWTNPQPFETLLSLGTKIYVSGEALKTGLQATTVTLGTSEGATITNTGNGPGQGRVRKTNSWWRTWYFEDGVPVPTTGWKQDGGAYYYFDGDAHALQNQWITTSKGAFYLTDDGSVAYSRWVAIDDIWYYFDAQGKLVKNQWLFSNGFWYRLDEEGKMLTSQWVEDGDTYWVDEEGHRAIGWRSIDNLYYYFNLLGAMQKGWLVDGGATYFLDLEHGNAWCGLAVIDGRTYFFSPTGAMQTGWVQIGIQLQYFDLDGARASGWRSIDNAWYLLSDEGVALTGFQQVGQDIYLLGADGKMCTGWQLLADGWHYFAPSGAMQHGWQWVGSNWYWLDDAGVLKTGWMLLGDVWYYLDATGAMATDWCQVGWTWYYFAPSGAMLHGWQWIRNAWYYMDNSGAMLTGWQWINSAWYYFDASGAMYDACWAYINGCWYGFWSGGVLCQGWVWDNFYGGWFYCDPISGIMQTGWQWIGNAWYYFYDNGLMATNTYIGRYWLGADGAMW